MKRAPRWAASVALVLASVTLTLSVVELLLRVFILELPSAVLIYLQALLAQKIIH